MATDRRPFLGMINVTRSKTLPAIGAVIVATVAILGASPAFASTQFSLDSESLIPALARTQTPSDIPDQELLDSIVGAEFDASSVRSVGKSDAADYFVAEGAVPGDVCLVVELKSAQMSGSACTEGDSFYTRGLALELRGEEAHPEQVATAYLLPPDVQPARGKQLAQDRAATVSTDRIIIIPSGGSAPDPASFVRVNSQTRA